MPPPVPAVPAVLAVLAVAVLLLVLAVAPLGTTAKRKKPPTTARPSLAPLPTLPPTAKPTKRRPTKPTKRTKAPTDRPSVVTTGAPTTQSPTSTSLPTSEPTSAGPTSAGPTSAGPTSAGPTSVGPTSAAPTLRPSTAKPSSSGDTTSPSTHPSGTPSAHPTTAAPHTSKPSPTPTRQPSASPSRSPFFLVHERWGVDNCTSTRFTAPYQRPGQCTHSFRNQVFEYRTCEELIRNTSMCAMSPAGSDVTPFRTCLNATAWEYEYEGSSSSTTGNDLQYVLTCNELIPPMAMFFVQVDYYMTDDTCQHGEVSEGGVFPYHECLATDAFPWNSRLPQFFSVDASGLHMRPFDVNGCNASVTPVPVALGNLTGVMFGLEPSACLPALPDYAAATNTSSRTGASSWGGFKFTSLPALLGQLPTSSPTPRPVHTTSPTAQPTTIILTKEPTRAPQNVSAADLAAWIGIYDELKGAAWIRCFSTRLTPCSCTGVTCANPSTYIGAFPGAAITSISLPNNNLQGYLPEDALNSLKSLSYLDMGGNPGLQLVPGQPCAQLTTCNYPSQCTLPTDIPLCPTRSPTRIPSSNGTGNGTQAPVAALPNEVSAGAIAAAVLVPLFVLLLCGLLAYWWWRKRKNNNNNAGEGGGGGAGSAPPPSGKAGEPAPDSPGQRRKPTPQAPLPTSSNSVWLTPSVQRDDPPPPDMPPPRPTRPSASSKPKLPPSSAASGRGSGGGRPDSSAAAPPTKRAAPPPAADSDNPFHNDEDEDDPFQGTDPFAQPASASRLQHKATSNPFDEEERDDEATL